MASDDKAKWAGHSVPIHIELRDDGTASITPGDPSAVSDIALRRALKAAAAGMLTGAGTWPVAFGLADMLVDDAVVAVVREPVSIVPSATIIVPAAATDDFAMCVGRGLLRADQRAVGTPDTRRVLVALPNGLVRLTVNGKHQWRRHGIRVYNVVSRGIDRLRLMAAGIEAIDIPDVGRARIVVASGGGP